MFAGIDEVDWASMEHAYGPADDVPGLLRGLASADAAEREQALDGMYGAVHHQGDVYDCTLACIPFLFELVVDPGIHDRGSIVELLTSIGGIDLDEDDDEDDVLRGAPEYRGERLRTSALRTLGSFGPAARCAVPELRALIRSPGTPAATEAAQSLSGDL